VHADGGPAGPAWPSLSLDLQAAAHIVRDMQLTILNDIGLTVSVGIGRTRLLSNLLSPLNKPHGISLLADPLRTRFMAQQPLHHIPGLRGQAGSTAAATLKIRTVGELASFSEADLSAKLGLRQASFLVALPSGGAHTEIVNCGPQKSLAVERSFPPVGAGPALEAMLDSLVEALWTRVVRPARVPADTRSDLRRTCFKNTLIL
jgi:DNA polymerase IV